MSMIEEEELKNANGGNIVDEIKDVYHYPCYTIGDRVWSYTHPEWGIGIVVNFDFNSGPDYIYTVEFGPDRFHKTRRQLHESDLVRE